MSSESRRLGGVRGQNVKNVRHDEDFEWLTVDGMPLKRRRKPVPVNTINRTMTPSKKTPKPEAAQPPFGAVPRPKYETGPSEERSSDVHSRDSNAESPYLKAFIPGTARG